MDPRPAAALAPSPSPPEDPARALSDNALDLLEALAAGDFTATADLMARHAELIQRLAARPDLDAATLAAALDRLRWLQLQMRPMLHLLGADDPANTYGPRGPKMHSSTPGLRLGVAR